MTKAKTPKINLIAASFEGLDIIFREDGWINATKAAKAFGKKPVKFLELPSTALYMGSLGRHLNVQKSDLSQIRRGNGLLDGVGTWLHPKMAVQFARWLDTDFAVWCDLTIDNIIRGNLQVKAVVPTQEALALEESLREAQIAVVRLVNEKKALEEELKGIREGEIPAHWMTAKVFLEE